MIPTPGRAPISALATTPMRCATRWGGSRMFNRPRAEEIDRTDVFPRDLSPSSASSACTASPWREYGGTGLGFLEHCVAMEEVSRASASVGLSYGAHSNLYVNQIRRNGSEAQKRRSARSDLRRACRRARHVGARRRMDVVSMRTRAERKGDRFVLNGSKMWITNGPEAENLVVYAKTDSAAGPRASPRS